MLDHQRNMDYMHSAVELAVQQVEIQQIEPVVASEMLVKVYSTVYQQ